MPDNSQTNTPPPAEPTPPADAQNVIANSNAIMQEVASKIAEASNILVALSNNPTVDDLAAAIGLSLYLDKIGKRATAIYSGATPNALEFLKPEESFDASTDTLQDFVIALNKDKADHLRYKLDGDYVKIFITPYRTRIAEDDLEFSYGDYNVDLVLALDVANGTDLDSALREHGRIMHDATIINITNHNPGKFGELEWSNTHASSVCEMLSELLIAISGKNPIDAETATALLTGIVASTDRFSDGNTTPDTMKIASRLMESGADQQLISQNITNAENQAISLAMAKSSDVTADNTSLEIEHKEPEDSKPKDGEEPTEASTEAPAESHAEISTESPVEASIETSTESSAVAPQEPQEPPAESPDLLSDLKAAEASLTHAGAETTPEDTQKPLRIDDSETSVPTPSTGLDSLPTVGPFGVEAPSPSVATSSGIISAPNLSDTLNITPTPSVPSADSEAFSEDGPKPEKIITPPEDFASDPTGAEQNKYGKMLEDALAEAGDASTPVVQDPAMSAPALPDANVTPTPVLPDANIAPTPALSDVNTAPAPELASNPAASIAPPVASEPEINGVPAINYMPLPEDQVLPPPPAPPVDFDSPMPTVSPTDSASSMVEPPLSATPDPSAFRIPGIQ
ncbi:hypothetical protein IJG04_00070 [Candidatus Saccharibacteria bacterium]|nr:hypothetical protein [Candidatus Saccharibacteria bacterium]